MLPQNPDKQTYEWDEATGQYIALAAFAGILALREAASASLVLEANEFIIEAAIRKMVGHGNALVNGSINLAEWQFRMMNEIKVLHTTAAAVGRGGWSQMTMGDWGWTGSQIRGQYAYLQGFAEEIFAGYPMDGRFFNRTNLYARAARGTYSQMERRNNEGMGMNEERRVLGLADHCQTSSVPGCVELANRGWQPIHSLPPIGGATCRQNCRCGFEFRRRVRETA